MTDIPNAISLFSGLGGDSLGMKMAGCNILAYNELKPTFCKSHDANLPGAELIQEGKIHDISKLKDECFAKYNGKTDIVFAGFPCQGFSTAGKKKKNDPRNTLFREFLRVTKLTNPYMIIGENVKGLLKRRTGSNSKEVDDEEDDDNDDENGEKDKGELYIDIIVAEFEQLGYKIQFKVFKCEQYGIPQKRERLIILGIKEDNPYGWKLSFPEPLDTTPNLIDIIKYDMTGSIKVDEKWFADIPDECILTNMSDTTKYNTDNGAHPYLVDKIYANNAKRSYSGKNYDYLFSFAKRDSPIHCEIIDIRNPSKTIICTYEHQPRLFVPLKNPSGCYLRMLLPDELKQIQGFPADYIVCGNNKEKIIQIGNAVPPPLIRAIVEKIVIT